MIRKILLLLVLAAFFSGCAKQSPEAECSSNADCAKAGCSGQICATKEKAADIITTCEYKAEYDCYKLTSCSCADGRCKWLENAEFLKCFNEKGG